MSCRHFCTEMSSSPVLTHHCVTDSFHSAIRRTNRPICMQNRQTYRSITLQIHVLRTVSMSPNHHHAVFTLTPFVILFHICQCRHIETYPISTQILRFGKDTICVHRVGLHCNLPIILFRVLLHTECMCLSPPALDHGPSYHLYHEHPIHCQHWEPAAHNMELLPLLRQWGLVWLLNSVNCSAGLIIYKYLG